MLRNPRNGFTLIEAVSALSLLFAVFLLTLPLLHQTYKTWGSQQLYYEQLYVMEKEAGRIHQSASAAVAPAAYTKGKIHVHIKVHKKGYNVCTSIEDTRNEQCVYVLPKQ
ncbi:hypothetical protein ACFOLK_06750 [Marinococcus halophilus]|uniref:Prepilin-type N-terminal cleavage/methylation domain-containing protein n=1 Tax=Marinococcus halophilus TaxID=1371 RepID=A0A510Y7Q0_MARHA|nr:hypothetical protein [Marinococcus halophilus]GEK59385.1 hypothetical protein MHA01_22900 [Marinococcus halophilus]